MFIHRPWPSFLKTVAIFVLDVRPQKTKRNPNPDSLNFLGINTYVCNAELVWSINTIVEAPQSRNHSVSPGGGRGGGGRACLPARKVPQSGIQLAYLTLLTSWGFHLILVGRENM